MSGSTGLVGSALIPALSASGYQIVRLVRKESNPNEGNIFWDPKLGNLPLDALEGMGAVVHLAGENVASGRWTEEKKSKIWDSRIRGTQVLADALARCQEKPSVFVGASAIGFYGDRGDEVLTEESPSGSGFFPDLCRKWEASAKPLVDAGIRVVHLRIGVVLSRSGGALQRMLLPFRLGLGGKLGSGRQYMSWVSLDDVVGAISHVLNQDGLHGPVNLMAPHPVTNFTFTKTLGRVLKRPTLFPVPEFMLRLVLGEMAENLLFASTRVEPTRLLAGGYRFRHPRLEDALQGLVQGEFRN